MSEAETSQPKRLKLSESEEQADSEQTYSPYYTANLRFILNFVLSKDSVDKNALKEDEICIIEKLKQLEGKVIFMCYLNSTLLYRNGSTTLHSVVFKKAPMDTGVQNKIPKDC